MANHDDLDWRWTLRLLLYFLLQIVFLVFAYLIYQDIQEYNRPYVVGAWALVIAIPVAIVPIFAFPWAIAQEKNERRKLRKRLRPRPLTAEQERAVAERNRQNQRNAALFAYIDMLALLLSGKMADVGSPGLQPKPTFSNYQLRVDHWDMPSIAVSIDVPPGGCWFSSDSVLEQYIPMIIITPRGDWEYFYESRTDRGPCWWSVSNRRSVGQSEMDPTKILAKVHALVTSLLQKYNPQAVSAVAPLAPDRLR